MSSSENYLILFADLVGSTDVASEVPPSFYAETYVASFHWAARKAEAFIKATAFPRDTFTKTIDTIRIAGDEVLSFTPIDLAPANEATRIGAEDTVASAVSFAYVTKLYWLASPYNLRRMLDRQFPRDVAVGIHIGPAALVPAPPTPATAPNGAARWERQIASLHLNVAKRIEGLSRTGQESRIFASYDVAEMFKAWAKRHKDRTPKERAPLTYTTFEDRSFVQPVKGLPKPIRVHELAWPPSSEDALMYLLQQMTVTPEVADIDAEKAACFLAEQYLQSDCFFQYDTGVLAVQCEVPNATTAEDYIARWFDAVSGPTKLFFDECWLVLNAFLISCSFLRHKDVPQTERKKYRDVAEKLLAQLRDLHKNRRRE